MTAALAAALYLAAGLLLAALGAVLVIAVGLAVEAVK